MLIQKFGGSSLASVKGFLAAADIISDVARDEKVIVVLSAVYGITDLLEKAITSAVSGDDFRLVLDDAEGKQQEILDEMRVAGFDCPTLFCSSSKNAWGHFWKARHCLSSVPLRHVPRSCRPAKGLAVV